MQNLYSAWLQNASQAIRTLNRTAATGVLRCGSFPSRAGIQGRQTRRRIFCCAALLLLAAMVPGQAQTLPNLITYNFTLADSNTLPGMSAAPGSACNGTIATVDEIDNLALIALYYQNGCYTDGSYNNLNYPVAHGTVSATNGGGTFDAYEVYPALTPATQFLGSQHGIYYRFPTIDNYSLYTLSGGTLSKVIDIPSSLITTTNGFTAVTSNNPVSVDGSAGPVIYVFALTSAQVSSYTTLASGVQGATIASAPFGNVLKYRYKISGTVFDTVTNYTSGPNDYADLKSNPRHFFLVQNGSSGLGTLWQDQSNNNIYLTWFGSNFLSNNTVALSNPSGQGLACAAGDNNGNVYYVTVAFGSTAPTTPIAATITKAGLTGTVLATTTLDTTLNGLDMVGFFDDPSIASLTYLNGQLGMIMGRTMLQSADGLNHQGGVAVVFNATSLGVVTNWGQTSGHSWDNVLLTNNNSQFLGFDLGDNFPRGINLHKFNATNNYSVVIDTYKTQHGTTAQNPAGATFPVYAAISTNGTTYYEWSNDNSTYTELGGLAQTAQGYLSCFIGERSPNTGGLLDNSRVGAALNDPRNIGFVTVREDFQNSTASGTIVTADLVLSSGLLETNGYYSFTGGWTPQQNDGAVWLTSYSTLSQNATRLRMTPRADGSLLLLWELWSTNGYTTTKGLTMTTNGTIVNPETNLGTLLRIGRRDDSLLFSNNIYLAAGNNADQVIELNVVQPASQSQPVVSIKPVLSGTNLNLSWSSTTGYTYQLQSIRNPSLTNWLNVGAAISGDGTTKTEAVPISATNLFFRLFIQP